MNSGKSLLPWLSLLPSRTGRISTSVSFPKFPVPPSQLSAGVGVFFSWSVVGVCVLFDIFFI